MFVTLRFGPVCLPDVECCFSGKDYTSAHRSELLNSIQTLPHRQWSTRLLWRFTVRVLAELTCVSRMVGQPVDAVVISEIVLCGLQFELS